MTNRFRGQLTGNLILRGLSGLPLRRAYFTGLSVNSLNQIARLLGLAVYFAHPYSSWERGTNENTNGLLRQYLPKETDFLQLTDWQLGTYVQQLNHRPRKCLNYRTPAEVFHQRDVAFTL